MPTLHSYLQDVVTVRYVPFPLVGRTLEVWDEPAFKCLFLPRIHPDEYIVLVIVFHPRENQIP